MSVPKSANSRATLRLAIIAAALGVAGMFTAAATFAGQEPATAAVASAEQAERG